MFTQGPHFLLFAESKYSPLQGECGRWRFVLEDFDGTTILDVEDSEFENRDRLELLSIVRGLESLEQPSRVTLITASRYVSHGLRFGLDEWRRSDWQWERF